MSAWETIGTLAATELIKLAFNVYAQAANICDQTFSDGSRWISYCDNANIISMYYHPTKEHTATAIREGAILHGVNNKVVGRKPGGKWAFACCKKGFGIGRTYYNIL